MIADGARESRINLIENVPLIFPLTLVANLSYYYCVLCANWPLAISLCSYNKAVAEYGRDLATNRVVCAL